MAAKQAFHWRMNFGMRSMRSPTPEKFQYPHCSTRLNTAAIQSTFHPLFEYLFSASCEKMLLALSIIGPTAKICAPEQRNVGYWPKRLATPKHAPQCLASRMI